MIMPAIFGAFGNFLLPTQLGVHDVAFPRLNSAAFWFLPGGLIMLCQLVCTDRRYARMNCFNIRELQSILKNKFFTDLVNSHDHRDLLNQSMIGLRFKQNNTTNLDLDMTSFYKYGLHETNLNKYYNFRNISINNLNLSNYEYKLLQLFNVNFTSMLLNFISSIKLIITELFTFFYGFNLSIPTISSFFPSFFKTMSFNFSLLITPNYYSAFYQNSESTINLERNTGVLNLTTSRNQDNLQAYTENSTNQRVTRYNTIFVNYDYKTGHYLGN